MTPLATLKTALTELLAEFADVPADPDAALDLESLVVVQLVEALEGRFGFTARAAELVPENLGTFAALTAWVARRASAGPPAGTPA